MQKFLLYLLWRFACIYDWGLRVGLFQTASFIGYEQVFAVKIEIIRKSQENTTLQTNRKSGDRGIGWRLACDVPLITISARASALPESAP